MFFFFLISYAEDEIAETEIIAYLEKCGFKICWHMRDFEPGESIAENIAQATLNSRRMIFLISR